LPLQPVVVKFLYEERQYQGDIVGIAAPRDRDPRQSAHRERKDLIAHLGYLLPEVRMIDGTAAALVDIAMEMLKKMRP
jgi:hypothetical protein